VGSETVCNKGDIMIKAIETVYNGYRFRSRLEARWAVFFDALGIEYQYEPEGFELSNGVWYLPDFYLPTFNNGMWCEVKPTSKNFRTAIQFSKDIAQPVWLCENTPTFAIYKYIDPDLAVYRCGVPNEWDAIGENRMFSQPCHLARYCSEKCYTKERIVVPDEKEFTQYYIDAVYAVRQLLDLACSLCW